MDQPSPLIFLSHSGADTEAARELKRRLLESPGARAAGLEVWFDKDGLRPGGQWQPQIEEAIAKATAFVVYVGSKGVMNWVEAEVRVALSRANTNKDFLFIPALAPGAPGRALCRLLQSFTRVSTIRSASLRSWRSCSRPLSGWNGTRRLSSSTSRSSACGRCARRRPTGSSGARQRSPGSSKEFRRHRIVAIVADSGTGKSSLAQAGFATTFRGGALIDPMREEAREKIWQVVTMRPGTDPAEGIRQGVETVARKLGCSIADIGALLDRVLITDSDKIAFTLRCGLPPEKTSTLLIVDQFEELFTTTPQKDAVDFARLLLALADGRSDVRVLITVRADYFNLASGIKDASGKPTLFERLTAENNAAILRLKAMSAEGMREAVCGPLKLAGEGTEPANEALLEAVQSDISHQASDLPLLQVALRAAWQEHGATRRPMLECYQSVGRVSGALAREADKARDRLPQEDQARLESIFVRLVRLGDTGGATRRPASLDEFDPPRKALLQKLGSDDYGRLIAVREQTAELAHEALITQWPWLQGRLRDDARDVRRLDRLMEKAHEWREAPAERQAAYLAAGAERDSFDELAAQRGDWLSPLDRDFVEASNRAYETEREKERRALRVARHNKSVALTALANIEAEKRPVNAAKLALAAWPRDGHDTITPKRPETLDALTRIVHNLRERRLIKGVHSAALNPDGSRIVTASDDNTARVWDAATGKEIAVLSGHQRNVTSAAFSPDGARVVTASYDKTARVWYAATGNAIAVLSGHEDWVKSAAFSPDGSRIVTASNDKTARVWDAATGNPIAVLSGHKDPVISAAFSPDGLRIVTAADEYTARVWDAATGNAIALSGHQRNVTSAAFSPDGARVVTASNDKTARVWDAATGKAIGVLSGHENWVRSAAFSPDRSRVLTASRDETARVWDATTGKAIVVHGGHEGRVFFAAISPDGSCIVTAPWDKTARIWDAATGKTIAVLSGHEGPVTCAAFGPDGSRIVTASDDKTARVWDAATGKAIAVLSGHEDQVHSAAFSPDGSRIVTASDDKTARVWDVSGIPKGNILQVACALLRLREDPVSFEGVTEYPLTFDRPICLTDPPPPDLMAEPAAAKPP